jgi:hypothetical protein
MPQAAIETGTGHRGQQRARRTQPCSDGMQQVGEDHGPDGGDQRLPPDGGSSGGDHGDAEQHGQQQPRPGRRTRHPSDAPGKRGRAWADPEGNLPVGITTWEAAGASWTAAGSCAPCQWLRW